MKAVTTDNIGLRVKGRGIFAQVRKKRRGGGVFRTCMCMWPLFTPSLLVPNERARWGWKVGIFEGQSWVCDAQRERERDR